MASKDLSRTVIEGGRARYNRVDRWRSNAVHRTRVRHACARIVAGAEPDGIAYPVRRPVWRVFDDKLSAARRWLRSNVGRPWNKVRSELFERFDVRTTAGRHIVFDHLLDEVALERTEPRASWVRFCLDRGGNLRENPGCRRPRGVVPRLPEPESVILAWLGGRRIAVHGRGLYWLVPTETGGFRQAKPLTRDERTRWLAIPGWLRERHTGPRAAEVERR